MSGQLTKTVNWAFQKRVLQETRAKTMRFKQRVRGSASAINGGKNHVFLNIKACKQILVDAKNKILNL